MGSATTGTYACGIHSITTIDYYTNADINACGKYAIAILLSIGSDDLDAHACKSAKRFAQISTQI